MAVSREGIKNTRGNTKIKDDGSKADGREMAKYA